MLDRKSQQDAPSRLHRVDRVDRRGSGTVTAEADTSTDPEASAGAIVMRGTD